MTTTPDHVQALAFSHVEAVEQTATRELADETAATPPGPLFSAPDQSHAPFPASRTDRTH